MTAILHLAMFSRRSFGSGSMNRQNSEVVYRQKNNKKNKQKTDKTKQKEDELPLHTHLEKAQYVPLQLYLVTVWSWLIQVTILRSNVNIKSTKKKLKTRLFSLTCYHRQFVLITRIIFLLFFVIFFLVVL